MQNNISDRVLSKNHSVKTQNFQGTTYCTEDQQKKLKAQLESKPSVTVVHADTNDLTKQINSSDSYEKSLNKHNEILAFTELVFSETILREDKTRFNKFGKA